jgi:hypothetical protein
VESLRKKVLKENQKKSRTQRTIERSLNPAELKELEELLRDEGIVLRVVHEVLIQRGVRLSYSGLYQYRIQVMAR